MPVVRKALSKQADSIQVKVGVQRAPRNCARTHTMPGAFSGGEGQTPCASRGRGRRGPSAHVLGSCEPQDFSGRSLRRAGSAVPVRLRALDGRPLSSRPGSDDPWVLREVFTYRDVLPPKEVRWPKLIFDLGADIGASMALLAETFPEARVVGVEPDPENVALCRRKRRAVERSMPDRGGGDVA
jgi:hypothetical protein